jgi:ADP-heptose:LPS heptosyltransferase
MIRSSAEPKPVQTGKYRYSKLRWRILVRAIDALGTIAIALFRLVRPARAVTNPRRILVVQLDHLGDAVLSTPLIAELKAAYPDATIEILASPSNHEVFEADPQIGAVHVAERTWFERRPDRWALVTAVWKLGRSLRARNYDLGIDVRGDVLTVTVLALAGITRRVGWAMGGGSFLLTDIAEWVPGRHEVRSRLALLRQLGITPDPLPRVEIPIADVDRVTVARRLAEAWPRRQSRRAEVFAQRSAQLRPPDRRGARQSNRPLEASVDSADWLHADRFTSLPPLLSVHLGAGTSAKRWPARSWKALVERFLSAGWRVIVIGGPDDVSHGAGLGPHERLRDWAGTLSVTETTALLERADLFIGADSGPAHLAASAGTLSVILFSGTNRARQWRPWSRHALTLKARVACRPCHQKACPLADHPCMTGLTADRVYRSAMRWWARAHRSESPHAPL